MHKSVPFPCTNNEEAEREIKKQAHLKYQQKIVRYPGINLTTEIKDL